MKLKILGWFLLPAGALLAAGQGSVPDTKPVSVASPDGRLVVDFRLTSAGAPRYAIRLAGRPVLQESRLGLVREDADFSQGLRLAGQSPTTAVRDRYEILTAKRRVNTYREPEGISPADRRRAEARRYLPGLQ
jgi:alpha-glucosidase